MYKEIVDYFAVLMNRISEAMRFAKIVGYSFKIVIWSLDQM